MLDESSGGGGVPVWFVTFSDMMSLLLTFFVMLFSCSEMKSEEKYQALMDAFQQQFGHHDSRERVLPGQMRPRNSALSKIAVRGRSKRLDSLSSVSQVHTPTGDSDFEPVLRSGPRTVVGTILYFQENQIELDESQRSMLRQQADRLRSKPHQLEIRGHTSIRPSQTGTPIRDHWDVSFERCRRVMQYLVEEQQIDSRRVRISAAADIEPLSVRTDHTKSRNDPRVEVYLLDEVVRVAAGTEAVHGGRREEEPGSTKHIDRTAATNQE